MKLSDFDYELPPERVAHEPSAVRDEARLLVHEIGADRTTHARVRDLPSFLAAGDLVVVNDTRVLPCRLFGRRASGGGVEFTLLAPVASSDEWEALVNPARKLHPGELVTLEGGAFRMCMRQRLASADGTPGPIWRVELAGGSEEGLLGLLERHGHTPLPPYIDRPKGGTLVAADLDRQRYQTVFAEHPGAVAAPTAGLHFTQELFDRLADAGVRRAQVTLHVGLGTFQPVQVERVEEHRMHAERFVLPADTVAAVEASRASGARVVAVGSTSVRVLESAADEQGALSATTGTTELFLVPGSPFRVVDVLLTNFHLPKSTLLMLVCAFAGRERVLRLYEEAIERAYRFYSYGDAMLLTK